MRLIIAVLLLLSAPDLPVPVEPLPHEVASAIAGGAYEIPGAVLPTRVARGDFDDNGYEDWAVLVADRRRAAILVAYRFTDHWRSGNIDVWGGPECDYCSPGPHPTQIILLPPGRHDRVPPYDRPLLANERERISSQLPGVLVVLADGRRRAYYLGDHAWGFVYLGLPR
jgi:hypothetical protein